MDGVKVVVEGHRVRNCRCDPRLVVDCGGGLGHVSHDVQVPARGAGEAI